MMAKYTVILAALVGGAAATNVSPIQKTVQLIDGLAAKVTAEGAASQKLFEEFTEWCEDRSKDLGFEIKTGKSEIESLQATIQEQLSTSSSLSTKIEELAGAIAKSEADLKDATGIRKEESADFQAEEKELMEIIDMLQRAINVLEREMAKGGASMMQMKNVNSLTKAFEVMVKGSLIDATDADKLSSFVQSSAAAEDSEAEEDDEALAGAPAAAAHESKSGGIVDVLQDLMDKANGQLDELRNKETQALHNYEMVKQSVMDELKFGNKDMAEAKKGLAASGERKSAAEGDLEVTSKDLAKGTEAKAELHHDCMSKAEEFEIETKSRSEEVEALTAAKKALQSVMSDASASAAASFVQVSSKAAQRSSERLKIVRFIKDLAHQTRAPALAQLARRMSTVLHSKARGPFSKVKAMITDMLGKLEDEAEEEATKKAWCDKEMGETADKQSDLDDDVEKISTKMEQMGAESATLKREVTKLQKELAKLTASQVEMDKLREEEKAAYEKDRADAEMTVDGVKKALSVLKETFAKDGGDTGGSAIDSILGLLEVIESDFSKELAEIISAEEAAVSAYNAETKENEIETTTKTTDVKHKTKQSASLDKAAAESKGDLANKNSRVEAVKEAMGKLQEDCLAKPESYAERKKRREKELAGLKEGLTILESQAAFLQEQGHPSLRGVSAHTQDA